MNRAFSPDVIVRQVDNALRTLHGVHRSARPSPASEPQPALDQQQRRLAGRLMRVNHTGEVCAQALYMGQGMTSRDRSTQESMSRAAQEETDHLAWCEGRLQELETHTSYLNPVFYALSFLGGAASGILGDRFNLGVVAATEEQVVKHLDEHLERLPREDTRSRSILEQMREDENRHRTRALKRGGANFPGLVKKAMTLLSRVMTRTTYWV